MYVPFYKNGKKYSYNKDETNLRDKCKIKLYEAWK